MSVTDVGKADPEVTPVRKKMLGGREPPMKKEKKKEIPEPEEETKEVEEREEEGDDSALDSLSGHGFPANPTEEELQQKKLNPSSGGPSVSDGSRCPRIKKSTYFTNEKNLVITITHIWYLSLQFKKKSWSIKF